MCSPSPTEKGNSIFPYYYLYNLTFPLSLPRETSFGLQVTKYTTKRRLNNVRNLLSQHNKQSKGKAISGLVNSEAQFRCFLSVHPASVMIAFIFILVLSWSSDGREGERDTNILWPWSHWILVYISLYLYILLCYVNGALKNWILLKWNKSF